MSTANARSSHSSAGIHAEIQRPARQLTIGAAALASFLCLASIATDSLSAQGRARLANSTDARAAAFQPSSPMAFEGFVLAADGKPAAGAVIVSSAGGEAVADGNGYYRVEVRVPADSNEVQVTAVGKHATDSVASARVGVLNVSRSAWVDPLVLAQAACSPSWLPTFEGQPGANDTVLALAMFDDGNGAALYAGGAFTSIGNASASHVARWDGSNWSSLGSGMDGDVLALAVYDDGSGPALFAGGAFTNAGGVAASRIAKWNGSSWSALGAGVNVAVNALATYDDGSGLALYVGGGFTSAGGASANRIARWNGTSWLALGAGMNQPVYALASYDDGSGAALYAGGDFTHAGSVSVNKLAKWDGSSWSTLGSALTGGAAPRVRALAVFDPGNGPALYVGGGFQTAGGISANNIARWDGSAWTALTSGTSLGVSAMTVYDDGDGPALYVGGSFAAAGGVPAKAVARWDGSNWSQLGSGLNPFPGAFALASYEDDGRPCLFAGGSIVSAGGTVARGIARWDGLAWSRFGDGLNDGVRALAQFDDGSGAALFAGGDFTTADGTGATGIAKWNGSQWSMLPGEFSGSVDALAVFDDGNGPALYLAGPFEIYVGGHTVASHLARWDGSSWAPLGQGLHHTVSFVSATALSVYDDGSGPALFVSGHFDTAGGLPAQNIAKWDGASWAPLGAGLSGEGAQSLAVFDDGDGPALYAGGAFTSAGGGAANRIAKWNGASWTPLGSGISGTFPSVDALTVFDAGDGPALYAGGSFTSAGGVAVNHVARWNGSSWSALGSGLTGNNDTVSALIAHDDGSGPALYAGGSFDTAGGIAAQNVARWDGSSWMPLGGGMNGDVLAFAPFDDGSGTALCAGGSFPGVLDSGDSFLAQWGCDTTPPVLSCPSSVTAADALHTAPGKVVTFVVTASDDHDHAPILVCVPPSGSFFAQGTTLVNCTATDASGNESTCQFPVTVEARTRTRSPH